MSGPLERRHYRDEQDYEAIRRLLVEIVRLDGLPTYCTLGELDWWRWAARNPIDLTTCRLWFAGDALAAAVWPDADEFSIFVHPAHRDLLGEAIDWAVRNGSAGTTSDGPVRTLAAWSFAADVARNNALAARGFAAGDPVYHDRVKRSLDAVPPPVLPVGYRIADLCGAGAETIERRVAVHRAAFAPSQMTVDKHRAVMTGPSYRPDLDLVIVAPDGSFAAFVIVWFDKVNRLGAFEPVGTHPDHQRHGLGTAILHEGMRRLGALGATRATVASAVGNTPSNRLYDKVGLIALDQTCGWTIAIEPAASASG